MLRCRKVLKRNPRVNTEREYARNVARFIRSSLAVIS